MAPEHVGIVPQSVSVSSGPGSLLFPSAEGGRGRNLHMANISPLWPAQYCVPTSELIHTEWVNNFVFSLCYKDSVIFGQVTSGNIIKYFSNSAFFMPHRALGKRPRINLGVEGEGSGMWTHLSIRGPSKLNPSTAQRDIGMEAHTELVSSATPSLGCLLPNSNRG